MASTSVVIRLADQVRAAIAAADLGVTVTCARTWRPRIDLSPSDPAAVLVFPARKETGHASRRTLEHSIVISVGIMQCVDPAVVAESDAVQVLSENIEAVLLAGVAWDGGVATPTLCTSEPLANIDMLDQHRIHQAVSNFSFNVTSERTLRAPIATGDGDDEPADDGGGEPPVEPEPD